LNLNDDSFSELGLNGVEMNDTIHTFDGAGQKSVPAAAIINNPPFSLSCGPKDGADCTSSPPNHIKKISIYGGKQCSGLASMLIQSRQNTDFQKYEVQSLTR
jgi:hypothetical protein